MNTPTHVPFVLAIALAGPVAAQGTLSDAVLTSDPRIAVHSNSAQPGEAQYGTWAAGATYKASFHDGMTFYPQLGRDYPRNQPLAWRTTSVRVGTEELLAADRVPEQAHRAYRVEYSLGAVIEAYDVRADGLEQTFVLAHRPRSNGDLRITGRLNTNLGTEAVEEIHGDLVFRDEAGTPIVRYGRALAIDADGDTFAMTTTCHGDIITLRLPAEALAQADFPLVVDPLLTPVLSLTQPGAAAVGEIDSAAENRNASLNGAYCVTRHFSATDADVIANICAANLTNATTRFSDLAASSSAEHGRMAFVAATNKWVVCYQSLALSTQIMQVRVAMFSGGATSPITTSSLALAQATGEHNWRPCAGGIAAGGAGTQALIAFQREVGPTIFANASDSEVFGVLFDTSSGLGSFGAPFQVFGSGVLDYERPAINRAAEGGTAFSWLVACQSLMPTSSPLWVLRTSLVANNTAVSQPHPLTAQSAEHRVGPLVDGRSGRYLVSYATTDSSAPAPTDARGTAIRCLRATWPHGNNTPSALPEQILQQNPLRLLENGSVAFHGSTRSHWTLAWRSSSTAPAVYATRVGYRGAALQSPELVASSSASIPGWPTVVNDDANDATTIGYQRHQGSVTEVWARTWINPTTPEQTLSASNCSTALLQWVGPSPSPINADQWIGGELSTIRVTSAPANSLHLMLVGTGAVDLPAAHPILGTNCSILVPVSGPEHLGLITVGVGSMVEWSVPLPETLPAITLHVQDWVLDPANDLLWGTRRLSVPLTR